MQEHQFAVRAEKIYPISVKQRDESQAKQMLGCFDGWRIGKIPINCRGLKTRVYHGKYKYKPTTTAAP